MISSPNLILLQYSIRFLKISVIQDNRFQDASQVPFQLQKPPKINLSYQMNGKRVNVESLLTCGNIFRTFLIEERVGESEKAFHDFTTCGRLSYRIKSTRVWETSQENKRASKHGEEFNKSFRSVREQAAGGARAARAGGGAYASVS